MKPIKPEGQTLDNQQLIGLKEEFQEELDHILDWWQNRMIDWENGGFYGRMDGQSQLHAEADKSVILNSRILWTFAAAARLSDNYGYKNTADRAYQYLKQHFVDPLEGGVFWMLDYKGEPVQTKKQIYAQAFTIYALSEYYMLTQSQEALNTVFEIFWLIEKYSYDRKTDGYYEAFNREWQTMHDLRLSEKDANAAKTMNTHLHVLEAYTNLYRACPHEAVSLALTKLIVCFLEKFIDPEHHHLNLFFDQEWNLSASHISYGHDIECSWLLWEAAEVLGDESLKKRVAPVVVQMAEATLQEGLAPNGGLNHEIEYNGHRNTDKHWWPQAEAVVGFHNAWLLSGKDHYLQAAQQSWSFIKKHLKDPKGGEWFWLVDQHEKPNLMEDKAGPWKAPYHNGRMCMEMRRRLSLY
ncbi:MAG: cellobiose 2-epimerase [Saprospiraceae bacterium]|nr:MAG: cellobiose 2-epimerase [Saprospiraceae bacterium]